MRIRRIGLHAAYMNLLDKKDLSDIIRTSTQDSVERDSHCLHSFR